MTDSSDGQEQPILGLVVNAETSSHIVLAAVPRPDNINFRIGHEPDTFNIALPVVQLSADGSLQPIGSSVALSAHRGFNGSISFNLDLEGGELPLADISQISGGQLIAEQAQAAFLALDAYSSADQHDGEPITGNHISEVSGIPVDNLTGGNMLQEAAISASVIESLNRQNLAPVTENINGTPQTVAINIDGDTIVIPPDHLFDPSQPDDRQLFLGVDENGNFIYGIEDTVLSQAVSVVDNLGDNTLSIRAVINDPDNPFDLRQSTTVIALVDANTNQVLGVLPSIFDANPGADAGLNQRIELSVQGQGLNMRVVRNIFDADTGTLMDTVEHPLIVPKGLQEGAVAAVDGVAYQLSDNRQWEIIPELAGINVSQIITDDQGAFALDEKGSKIMTLSAETGEWETFELYNLVTPENLSKISTVELELTPDGNLLLPKDLIEWEHANALDIIDDIEVNYIFLQNVSSPSSFLSWTFASPNSEVSRFFNIYNISLKPWGIDEDGYLISAQLTTNDKQPHFIHIITVKPIFQNLVDKNMFYNKVFKARVEISKQATINTYPEGYTELAKNLYTVQYPSGGLTQVENFIRIAGKTDLISEEIERTIYHLTVISP